MVKTVFDYNRYGNSSYKNSPAWKQYKELLTQNGVSGTLGTGGGNWGTTSGGNNSGDDGKKKKGRGSGSGGGSGRASLNLKVYHPLDYSAKGLRARATTQANAQNREAYGASQISRNSANSMYNQNIRGLDYQQNIDNRGLDSEYRGITSGNANTALNRGMGFGQGYQNVQTAAGIGHEQATSDLLNQYLVQRQNALETRNTVYGNMDEQDRITRANRLATIDALFAQYDDTAYNRYLKNEALRQVEIQSGNAAIAAR
jgi:hypothetical protein